MQAFNITQEGWRSGKAPAGQGWTFGLPPGIAPAQWPLDPMNGYPLMHGFTLWLPQDYRVHGPDIVALSFFATSPDYNDGGPTRGDSRLNDIVLTPGDTPPADAALLPVWERARQVHPRTHRMSDILGCAYAVVLLTQAEFEGEPCRPAVPDSPAVARLQPPEWLAMGSAAVLAQTIPQSLPANHGDALTLHRPLTLSARADDPNAGKPPTDTYGDPEPSEEGYVSHYYWEGGVVSGETYREYPWGADHAPDHLGGTMRPIQGTPEFSPFYVGFEEEFGGYNFGGGNAQLDFKHMKFDWACG